MEHSPEQLKKMGDGKNKIFFFILSQQKCEGEYDCVKNQYVLFLFWIGRWENNE